MADLRTKPEVIKWKDQRLDWGSLVLPLSDRNGWHRGHHGRYLETSSTRMRVVYLPIGQASPFHVVPAEMMFLQLEGEVEFCVGPTPDDMERFHLEPYDALFVPLEAGYEYTNIGSVDVRFLTVLSRDGDEWPSEVTYFLPGEDVPLVHKRPDIKA